MKTRRILMILLVTCFISSIAFAAEPILVATNEGEGNEYYFANSEVEDTFFDDALYPEQVERLSVSKTYTVVEGDNLYRIALKHDISLESLLAWNNLTGDLIYPDDVLIVSGEELSNQEKQVATATVSTFTNPVPVEKTVQEPKQAPKPTQKKAPVSVVEPEVAVTGKEIIVTATAYTAYCEGCSGTTAYGIDLRANPNQKVIAVDPRLIELGTKVWVEGYGEAIAGDTGGAIKGNKIDVFLPTYESAIQWGVKTVKLVVLE